MLDTAKFFYTLFYLILITAMELATLILNLRYGWKLERCEGRIKRVSGRRNK